MKDVCIVSVVVGAKYKKFANLFCYDYNIETGDHTNTRPEVILVVDDYDGLNVSKYDFVTVKTLPEDALHDIDTGRTFGTGTVKNFDYSLKRFGYQAAIDAGYTDIIFIDMDMTIRKWDESVFDACTPPGLWAGRGYSSAGFGGGWPGKHVSDIKFTPKLRALKKELDYETDWLNYKMPFEAVMYIAGVQKPVIQSFIDNWKIVSDATKLLNLPKNKVTHEIGLAADMCKLPIYFNKQLLSVVFKHYIMNHKALLNIHKAAFGDS